MKTDYKQSAVDRKDYRHTKVPEESFRPPTKNKRPRPVIVESRWSPDGQFSRLLDAKDGGWYKWGKYRTLKEAEEAVSRANLKYSKFMEYRIKPEDEKVDETT